MEDSRRTLPVVQRQRTVTGGHRAVVVARESGELDDETRQFLETLRGLEPAERATQLRAWMAQRGASQAAIQAAVTQVLNGGLEALRTHLTNTRDIRLREIDDAGQTRRAQINADRDIELEEIRLRAGTSNPNQGGAGGGSSNPNDDEDPTAQAPKGLSTGAKVAIGVGAGAAVLTVGYLLWQAMENRRREEEEKRRRDEEFRLRMLQAGAR